MKLAKELGWSEWAAGTNWNKHKALKRSETSSTPKIASPPRFTPACPLSLPQGLRPWVCVTKHGSLRLQEPRTRSAGGTAGWECPSFATKLAWPGLHHKVPRGKGVRGPQGPGPGPGPRSRAWAWVTRPLTAPQAASVHEETSCWMKHFLSFLETTQMKGRGFSQYIKYFLAKQESFSFEHHRGTA